jgi:hypothetical protein
MVKFHDELNYLAKDLRRRYLIADSEFAETIAEAVKLAIEDATITEVEEMFSNQTLIEQIQSFFDVLNDPGSSLHKNTLRTRAVGKGVQDVLRAYRGLVLAIYGLNISLPQVPESVWELGKKK